MALFQSLDSLVGAYDGKQRFGTCGSNINGLPLSLIYSLITNPEYYRLSLQALESRDGVNKDALLSAVIFNCPLDTGDVNALF
ncbi:hypothetical protein CBM2633_A10283 [Cupriavidus taiwanensis]|nr:hypothetical protein CBM2633_A10283 [Cupriavidus taiwanensis]